MPNYVSAADYANSEPAKKQYSAAMAYQNDHPATSSYMPSAATANGRNPNTPMDYSPSQGGYTVGGSSGMRNGVSTTAYSDASTANWNNMSPTQRDTWSKAGGNMAELSDANYLSRINGSPAVNYPGMAAPAMAGGEKIAQAPQTAMSSATMGGMAFTPTGGNMGNNMNQSGYPPMPQTTGGFAVKTPAQISAEAKARTDALLAKQTTIANQTKQGFNTAYDRLQSQTKDDRTLQDAAFQRNTNPFSGATGFQKDMTGRQREISDQQSKQDLQTRLANVDLSLADYANATDAQRMQMETDMTNAERSYGLQVDQLGMQRQQMNQTQSNADRAFNYGAGQDQIRNSQWNQTYNAGRQDAAAAQTGYYNPSGMSASQINQEIAQNSASYANSTPEQQQQLHARNSYLNSLIGKNDSTGNGDYVGGNPNSQVGYKTIQGQQVDFSQNMAMRELTNKIQQQHIALAEALTKAYGVNVNPTDDPAESFKQVEGRVPIDMQQLDIAKQNAASLEEDRKAMATYRNAEARRQDSLATNSINTSNRAATNAEQTAANQKQNRLISIWHSQGKAPAGIDGVAEGTPYTGQAKPESKNSVDSTYVSNLSSMTPGNRDQFFKNEKANIIKDLGISGYNQLYNMYYDQYGAPKQ